MAKTQSSMGMEEVSMNRKFVEKVALIFEYFMIVPFVISAFPVFLGLHILKSIQHRKAQKHNCPICNEKLRLLGQPYCHNCGAKLDWPNDLILKYLNYAPTLP